MTFAFFFCFVKDLGGFLAPAFCFFLLCYWLFWVCCMYVQACFQVAYPSAFFCRFLLELSMGGRSGYLFLSFGHLFLLQGELWVNDGYVGVLLRIY